MQEDPNVELAAESQPMEIDLENLLRHHDHIDSIVRNSDSMLESFLYHPLCLMYSSTGNIIAKDDTVLKRLQSQQLLLTPPPGRDTFRDIPASFDHEAIVKDWARSKRMLMIRRNHIVMCPETSTIFLVDYVMETDVEDFLVSVYYSPRRGGKTLLESGDYMQSVEKVCNKHMKFFPTCISLCIYGDKTAKVYGKKVNGGILDDMENGYPGEPETSEMEVSFLNSLPSG